MEFNTEPQIVGIISGNSTRKAKISNRASHTLIFKESGESIYHLRGKNIHFTSNTVLFVPEGESYSFEKISSGDSIYHLINFHANTQMPPAPKLFVLQESDVIAAVFSQMEKKQHFSDETIRKYELLSLFYRLLSLLVNNETASYLPKEKKAQIAPAIDYLATHLFDANVKIADLHTMCGISAPTFRRIFTASFHTSPCKYLIRQRLIQAKLMLESGEFKNIAQIARTVGFDDPLYFSRLFKHYYQVPPSQFKKI